MRLVYERQGALGLLSVVSTLEQVLVEVDLTNILIVLHSLFVDNNVVDDTLW